LNIMEFVNQFNKATAKMEDGMIIPAEVLVHPDKTFTMRLKTPPVSYLIKKSVGIMKGSGEPNKTKVGKITRKQVEEIAKVKMPDLNTSHLDEAIRIVEGSARSMGVEIV
jgi:large subunit ribosomal protein L11